MGGSVGSTLGDIANPIGYGIQKVGDTFGANQTFDSIVNPTGVAGGQIQKTLFPGGSPGGPPQLGQAGSTTAGYQNGQPITFTNQGLPSSYPTSALPQAYENINNLYGNLAQQAPGYYNQAQNATTAANNQGIGSINSIYGNAMGQSRDITNQNQKDLTSQMDQYDKNFVSQLGPSGQLGQQLMGEFNNYGITPQSGAFQSALGNQLGTLGGQNQFQLGSQIANQGAQAQQQLLGQGTQQAGTTANLGAIQNMTLGSEGALSPLSYMNQATGAQQGIINQAAQLPIDYWGSQNNQAFAQNLANQNQASQQNASQMGLLGNVLGAGATVAAK